MRFSNLVGIIISFYTLEIEKTYLLIVDFWF